MVVRIEYDDLVRSKILISYDRRRPILRVLLSRDHAEFGTVGSMLKRVGFIQREGPYWERLIVSDELERGDNQLAMVLQSTGVWDLGRCFVSDRTLPLFAIDELPGFWQGSFALLVRFTDHCLLFDRDDPQSEIHCSYTEKYQEYLVCEFHPSE